MSYIYENEKENIFTESGQVMFLDIRDHIKKLLKASGAFDMGSAIHGQTGNAWEMMACVDRLVELGELKEIPTKGAGQHRIFIST